MLKSVPRLRMACSKWIMVARRATVDAPWMIDTSLARRVVVTFPAGTSAAFFNDDAIETFDPSEGSPEAVHSVSLTLYRALYQIGVSSELGVGGGI